MKGVRADFDSRRPAVGPTMGAGVSAMSIIGGAAVAVTDSSSGVGSIYGSSVFEPGNAFAVMAGSFGGGGVFDHLLSLVQQVEQPPLHVSMGSRCRADTWVVRQVLQQPVNVNPPGRLRSRSAAFRNTSHPLVYVRQC